jgi:transcriptional regulator with XRE-family HTH domain
VTPQQCRAARAFLGWTQTRLAKASGLGESTVLDFERGKRQVAAGSITAMQRALEADRQRWRPPKRVPDALSLYRAGEAKLTIQAHWLG